MRKIAHEMFELAFDGYGTEELSKMANIPLGDAILIQSGSPNISVDSIEKMKLTIIKLQKNL